MGVNVETLTGPAFAASYFVNGDDSALDAGDRDKLDAWRKREGVADIMGIAHDSERFTWSGLIHYPEGGAAGLTVCDYQCIMAD